jgi:hypothetical protein
MLERRDRELFDPEKSLKVIWLAEGDIIELRKDGKCTVQEVQGATVTVQTESGEIKQLGLVEDLWRLLGVTPRPAAIAAAAPVAGGLNALSNTVGIALANI